MENGFISYTNTGTKASPLLEKQGRKHRVGIFGGTFNPIHNGQLIAAEQVCDQLALEKLYFMPDSIPFSPTHKSAIEPAHRAEMIRLAIRGNSKFDIEMTPIRNGGRQGSYKVLNRLASQHPKNDYFFIMGKKIFNNFPKWDNAYDLAKIAHLVVIDRPDGIKKINKMQAIWLRTNWLDISSSDIRSRLRVKESVRYLIPDVVAAYISEFGLYQGRYI